MSDTPRVAAQYSAWVEVYEQGNRAGLPKPMGPWDFARQLERELADAYERCLGIVETYKVPVGNSAAGEMACEWTMEALSEIRAAIRALNSKSQLESA